MLKEFHILKGRDTTFDPKTYTKVILNIKIEKKIAKDDLGNDQQAGDGSLLVSDDLQLHSEQRRCYMTRGERDVTGHSHG